MLAKQTLELWHSSNVTFKNVTCKPGIDFQVTEFKDSFKEAYSKQNALRFNSYSTQAGKSSIKGFFPRCHVFPLGYSVVEDFVLIDSSSIWFDIPSGNNSTYNSLIKKRIAFSIRSNYMCGLFRKLMGLNVIQDETKESERLKATQKKSFGDFLDRKKRCHSCMGHVGLEKSKRGEYYIRCVSCKRTYATFISDELVEEFLRENSLKCKECGGDLVLGDYHRLYCVNNNRHRFSIKDIIEKY